MMKSIKWCLLYLFFSSVVFAQQDEQTSFYQYNGLMFNPATAGVEGGFNALVGTRNQWIGLKGAPASQFLSVHSPITFKNMALGGHIISDRIGSRSRTTFFGDYSYSLHFGADKQLNFGLSAGGEQISINYTDLVAVDPTDPTYTAGFSKLKLNVGAGLFYQDKNWFAGFSVPRINESSITGTNGVVISGEYIKRHYYLMGGYTHAVNSILDVKASTLVKVVSNAPVSVDINAGVEYMNNFSLGLLYRYNASVGFNFTYLLDSDLRFGYAFDFPVNGLVTAKTFGSHELMLLYSMNKKKNVGSPRYF